MNFFSKWKSRLVFVALFATAVSAHAEDELAKVKKTGELVIGTEMQFAPFDFVENGEQRGFNKDFFAEVGKELGVKVRSIDLPWASVLPGLEAGKFDIVSGPVTISKARMERYEFTLPIADATDALLKRANDASIKQSSDVAGKIVGGGKGSAQLDQLKKYVASLPGKTEVREYVDNNQAYADLAAGRIAAVGNSLPNIAYVARQRPDIFAVVQPPFGTRVYFAYLGRKDADSKSLIDAIDQVIVKMHDDGRLSELQKKWFGVTMDTPKTMPTAIY
ncbi:transporter substrate-binding domain-containing protein [Caballeronia sordidicola]|uniref:Glutamine ABC transporter, periplasmic glutamine-binding protein n=1 Tax=Caballeronia sordidicola TaxID=196367 RepID=A0A226X3L8_CABSO|nr:transporter substrate-binding domain-containing protein [Caballeronia sordidicola]OXC77478.1 Glutamine ABC transporter, periplasmic glutamine-binding protein [Caballeronia sordidicola]